MRTRRVVVAACAATTLLATALLTTACSAGQAAGADAATVTVVASTDVYGDLASAVAGRLSGDPVRVRSIIDSADVDPHSYEANARAELAIARADLIIENGGGYDDFLDTMRKATHSRGRVVNAVAISGKHGPDLNEHVWYDFPTVRAVVSAIADALAALDQPDAATFRANAHAIDARIGRLQAEAAAIRAAHAGTEVAITEPLPVYLLSACGLVNRTPASFSAAIEEDNDVPTNVLRKTLQLFAHRQVQLLAYDAQTSSVETRRVLAAAKSADVAVVELTETVPKGQSYLSWMSANLAAVRKALA